MKKLLLSGMTLAIIAAGASQLYINHFDKTQAALLLEQNRPTSANGQAIAKIFYDNSCQYCHTPDAALPAYSLLPIASTMMAKDIRHGTGSFLLNDVISNLDNPENITTSDLNKLEYAFRHNTMPIPIFKMAHWGAGPTSKQRQQILDWIAEVREAKGEPVSDGAFVTPVPDTLPTDPQKVALGDTLYHSTLLSLDNTVSCATCHQLENGGDDNMVTSTGIFDQKGDINAPTVYNAALNFSQFWDGRAADLAAQAGGPPMNPVEMGSANWDEIIAKLAQDDALKQQFLAIYGTISGDAITDAIAEFEKTLLTPNSPFDRHLKNEPDQLTATQLKGYELFREYRCDTCHGGANMGGNSYELFGIFGDYYKDRGTPMTNADHGRFSQTANPADKSRFKVPTLRNVALTSPYMHDGASATLEQAVEVMLKYQVNVTPKKDEVSAIVDFLQSLTGEYQGQPLTES